MRDLAFRMNSSDTSAPESAESVRDSCYIIPGLPNDLAFLCLAFVPLCHHSRLKAVSKTWHSAFSSRQILEIRRKWKKIEEFLCVFRDDPSLTHGQIFDPRTEASALLPLMPCDVSTYGLTNFHCTAVGSWLYIIGGSLFDTRSFPMDRPLASSKVYRYDHSQRCWERLSNMKVPRGSFACGISDGFIVVAGGGSRHAQFPAGGSRISAAEKYDMKNDRWCFVEGLKSIRAGCVGFMYGGEFWVIGGYGSPRTIAGVLPTDDYYRDGEILDLKTGKWRYLQPMWEEGERRNLGKVVVINPEHSSEAGIFMLDGSVIFRYDVPANIWVRETVLPLKIHPKSFCKLVALDDELFVMSVDYRKRRNGALLFQIYHPRKRIWRFLSSKPSPTHPSLHARVAVSVCTIKL